MERSGQIICANFVIQHVEKIRSEAEKKTNEVEGARLAVIEGYILPDELSLLHECHLSISKALEISRELGLAGGVHQIDALVYRQQWLNLRAIYRAQCDLFFEVSGGDERFRESMLARAAASWITHSNYLPVGAVEDDNVDLYLWDYCFQFGNTKTWEPSITISKQHPVGFAAQWNRSLHADYNGPFVNRDSGERILSIHDLPNLVTLAPIAATNLTDIPIPPRDVTEATAAHFFGKCVVEPAADHLRNTVFTGQPISTTNWATAMQQVYAGQPLPPIPRTYSWPKVPTYPAADFMRAAAREDYWNFDNTMSKGGLKAHNAIAVQTMRRLHGILVGRTFDLLGWQRISDLLRNWLHDENDTILEITTENAIISAREIRRIEREAMKRMQQPGEDEMEN